MPTPGIRLGVDFGTSNTVAVVRWPDGRSRPLIFDGSPLLPSAVYAEPGGAIIVGRDAVHSARLEPARFEPNPKRRIDEGTVLLGDREVPVNELIAAVLRRVRDEWARTIGSDAPDVTVTFPASWGATRRLSVADAAATAGLGRVRLVPEPVAAAAYFTQVLGRDVPVGSVVVVHDFGAGTFDASVVARTAGGFEVLAVDGRDDIGGIDVDNAVVAHIGSICQPRAPQEWQRLMSPQTVEDRRHRRLLFDDARVAKERLSRQPASDLTVPLLNVDVHLTREEIERLAQPLLEQTVRVTQGVMRWAQLAEGAVAGVFLVGGSSRMPLVATLLHRALGTAPVAIEQPELVVAEGSMLAGSTATQAGAAPAPGPSTGVLPQVPGFLWQPPSSSGAGPVAAPPGAVPSGGALPGSSTPVSVPSGGAPVSASPSGGPLWPDAGSVGADARTPDAPVSGLPVSGSPVPGPPVPAPPVPAPPVPGPPVSLPVSGSPVSGLPVSGAPVSGSPVSGSPVSGPPVSGSPVSGLPVSGTPVSGSPVSGSPVSGIPVSGAPASGVPGGRPGGPGGPGPVPPRGQRPAGRVFVSGGVPEPSTRYDEYGSPLRGDAPPPPPPRVPSVSRPAFSPSSASSRPSGFPEPPASARRPGFPEASGPAAGPARPGARVQDAGTVHDGGRPRRGPVARVLLALFVLVLLVVTPVAAGCVSYYLTTDHWPRPVADWLDSGNP